MLVVLGGFLAAVIASELALLGTRVQTGLGRVMLVHVLVLVAVYWALSTTGEIGAITLLLFWTGASLSWFGVRSHIESSILLRMLFLLRQSSMKQEELLGEYESHYGESQRIEELLRAGLIQKTSGGMVPTNKGMWILRIVSLLK